MWKIRFHTAMCLSGLLAACAGPDLGARIAASPLTGKGVAADDQRVAGGAVLMKPRVEDLTDEGFNIRYIELSFGTGTPASVRDMAVVQCAALGKTAVYQGTSRGLVQFNTVKAYYACVESAQG